jgi:CHAT domain-containing protein/tetratricopeptide (TPR) repeat protein
MRILAPGRNILASAVAGMWLATMTAAPCLAQLQTLDAPPGAVDDITAILDQEKPDPTITAKRIADADAVPPKNVDDRTLAQFYYARAQARSSLGRSYDAIADCEAAMRYGKGSNYSNEFSRYQQFLQFELPKVGELERAISLENAQIAVFQRLERGRLFNLNRQLLNAYIDMGDLDRAETYLRHDRALLEESKAWGDSALHLSDRLQVIDGASGRLLLAKRRYAEAEAAFHRAQPEQSEAMVQSREWPSAPPQITFERGIDRSLADEGRAKARQGRVAEAEVDLRRALLSRLSKEGKYNTNTADILRIFADVLIEQGRYSDAEKLARAVIDIYRTIGFPDNAPAVVFADNDLAQILVLQRRNDDASAIYRHIDEVAATWPQWRREQFDSLDRAWTLLEKGRPVDVLGLATRALERERTRSGDKSLQTAMVRGLRAAALGAAGRQSEAIAEFNASIPVLVAVSRENDDEEGAVAVGRENRIRRVVEAYIGFLAHNPALAAGGAGEETFGLADTLRGQAVQRALAASSARAAAKDPALAELVRKEQDLKKQIGGLLTDMSNMLARPAAERDQNAVKKTQAQIEKLRATHATMRRDIGRRFPSYGNLIDPAPVQAGDIRAVLRPDEVLVSFYFGAFDSFAWVVPKAGTVRFVRLEIRPADLDEKVAKLRAALEPSIDTIGDIPPFDVALAHELFASLLEPTRAAWQPAKHLIVVTNGPLAMLPLGLLPTTPAQLKDDDGPLFANYRQVPWLARTHAVTMVPSAAALRTLRELPPNRRQRAPLVGFGDPYFSVAQATEAHVGVSQPADAEHESAPVQVADSTRGAPIKLRAVRQMIGVDSAEFALLPRLPETADELKAMALALKTDPGQALHLGKDANERTVKGLDLSKYRVIAFATHGLLPGDLDGLIQPALALTAPKVAAVDGDGLLTLGEVLGLKLDADWVVLSACNSGAGAGAGAEAASGLARAFFYAGTRAVLVTNWPVHSASARELVSSLFRRQAADPNLARAEALRQAMVSMIDTQGFPDSTGKIEFSYAHPMFWAPYSIIGDGGGI